MQLVERASQLNALNSMLAEVRAGEGRIALVYGEAGIGKTSLVEQFGKQNRHAWRLLSGTCDLLFTPRPLGPLGDIALQAQGRLLHLLESGAARDALFSACLVELQDRPTILVVEDVHWADEATLDLLKYLGRRIRQTRCLLLLTYRDDEVADGSPLRILLGDLAASHAVHRIAVPALTVEGVRELATGRGLDASALHRLTNGNPFFLTEILASGGGIPQTVRDAMMARAARLSRSGRNALEAAAVVGLRVEAWLLEQMIGPDGAGVEECISKGLLQQQGDAYAFRHELARRAILECISLRRKRDANRKALAALREHPEAHGDLARLASYAEGTGEAAAVLEYAPAAARQAAAAGAHRQAVALYELALRFADALPPLEHAHLLEAYADETSYLGWQAAMIPLRQQIVERYRILGERLREGRNLASLASELANTDRGAESDADFSAALAILEALPAGPELAQAYRQRTFLLSLRMDYHGALEMGQKAITLAERFGAMSTLSCVLNITAGPMLWMGDERGRTLMQRSLAVAREYGLHYAVGLALSQWASVLAVIFEFDEAARLAQDSIAYTRQHDDDGHLAAVAPIQALIKLYQGHWCEAIEILEHARQQPCYPLIRKDAMYLLGRLGVRRGDAGAPETLREVLASYIRVRSLDILASVHAGLAEAAWLAGDNHSALEEAQAVYDLFASQHVVWFTGELAFWRWRAGDVFTPPDWIAKPYALQIAGEWRLAAHEWEQRGCPYEQGMALMDGDETAQLEALQIFARLGARPILEKLKQRMRAEGIHRIPRGPRPATRVNQFGFTPREMEVLACLVDGASNNMIARHLSLSVRTVEHHIASMLQKAGVQSRGELMALARKQNVPLAQ